MSNVGNCAVDPSPFSESWQNTSTMSTSVTEKRFEEGAVGGLALDVDHPYLNLCTQIGTH